MLFISITIADFYGILIQYTAVRFYKVGNLFLARVYYSDTPKLLIM